jgi:plastocyanin
MRRPFHLVAAVVAATSLAACGDDTTSSDSSHMNGGMGRERQGHDGMGHGGDSPVVAGARRIEVSATSFEFDPDRIRVDAGEDVAIVLTSDDILHDFTVDELDAHVTADADETADGGLRAEEPGRYAFYCSVSGHRAAGMEGTLVVEAR